jgi:hypothetical protein
MSQGEVAVTLRTPHLAVQQSYLSTSIILELRGNTNLVFQTSQEELRATAFIGTYYCMRSSNIPWFRGGCVMIVLRTSVLTSFFRLALP